MGNVANKRALYYQFTGDRRDNDLGDPARWTEANEEALIALRDTLIEIGDTVYGQYEAQKKRDVKTAYQKISAKEKESPSSGSSWRSTKWPPGTAVPPYKYYPSIDNIY
jgi:hypothetical protein